jgi:ATP-dependent protease HslVU (ClpYQ) peptidase subunit
MEHVMSVIVASTNKNECWMAFDSAAAGSDTILETTTPKAIKHAGNGVVGAAGSWRVINMISNLKDKVCTPQDIIVMLKNVKNEEESMSDMEILCAWPNHPLVIIQSDLSMIELKSPFMAVGSGAPYSLGYLEACEEYGKAELVYSVEVAAKYSTVVAKPVKSLHCALVKGL